MDFGGGGTGGAGHGEHHSGPLPCSQLEWDARVDVPIGKGCRQGAPKSRTLWIILLDDAIAPVLQQWEEGYGIHIPALESDLRSRQPKNWGDSAVWVSRLAFADGLILITRSADDVRNMYRMMLLAWASRSGTTRSACGATSRGRVSGSVRRPSFRRPV